MFENFSICKCFWGKLLKLKLYCSRIWSSQNGGTRQKRIFQQNILTGGSVSRILMKPGRQRKQWFLCHFVTVIKKHQHHSNVFFFLWIGVTRTVYQSNLTMLIQLVLETCCFIRPTVPKHDTRWHSTLVDNNDHAVTIRQHCKMVPAIPTPTYGNLQTPSSGWGEKLEMESIYFYIPHLKTITIKVLECSTHSKTSG